MTKKTKYPGVTRLSDGRFKVRVSARHPVTGQKKLRVQTLDRMPIERVVAARAQMVVALKRELVEQQEVETKARDAFSEIVTVADYAELWTERRVSRLKPSVQEHYTKALADRVLPKLGEVPIREITRDHVIQWILWIERQVSPRLGRVYSTDSMRSWWRPLRTMLKDAAADLGLHDPTFRVTPPRSRVSDVREKNTLTCEQLGVFLEVVREHFPEWYAEVYVMAFTGMRPGELYALKWAHVDTEKGCIHVREAVYRQHVGTTKTGAQRVVALPEAMKAVLLAHRQELLREQGPRLRSGLVFPSKTGKYRYTSALHKALRTAAQVAGIEQKVSAQVLRRTFNTLLVEEGVNQVVLRSQMGHSSAAMTHRYAGVHIERKVEAVELLRRKVQGDD